jgi:hypothetical protein
MPADGTLSGSARVWGCTTVSNSSLVEKRVRDAVCDAVRDARCAAGWACCVLVEVSLLATSTCSLR